MDASSSPALERRMHDGSSLERKSAPYLFWGETTSLCETCYALAPAKIVIESDDVYSAAAGGGKI